MWQEGPEKAEARRAFHLPQYSKRREEKGPKEGRGEAAVAAARDAHVARGEAPREGEDGPACVCACVRVCARARVRVRVRMPPAFDQCPLTLASLSHTFLVLFLSLSPTPSSIQVVSVSISLSHSSTPRAYPAAARRRGRRRKVSAMSLWAGTKVLMKGEGGGRVQGKNTS